MPKKQSQKEQKNLQNREVKAIFNAFRDQLKKKEIASHLSFLRESEEEKKIEKIHQENKISHDEWKKSVDEWKQNRKKMFKHYLTVTKKYRKTIRRALSVH
jgi:uridine kinase